MVRSLWFRLDDVVPLAEHATACPDHRLTKAQTLAGEPLRPALIWTGTAAEDLMHSNGVPAWHGPLGRMHRASAQTWRHPATGRSGNANLPGYHTAYLPLTDTPTTRGLIDAIRDAHRQHQHWMRISIDPTDQHRIGPHRVAFSWHRDDLVPADARWTPATVTCDTVAGAAYPALIADGYTTTDGHQLPRFDRTVVEDLIGDLDAIHDNPDRASDPMPGEYPRLRHLDDDGFDDTVGVYEEHDDGLHTVARQVEQIQPDHSGRYSIGAYLWPWRRCDT